MPAAASLPDPISRDVKTPDVSQTSGIFASALPCYVASMSYPRFVTQPARPYAFAGFTPRIRFSSFFAIF